MKTLFSVIVPIYNKEEYLNKCIDSILNQSFNDYELILVNDGSIDNCPQIIDQYAKKDKKIKIIHKENGGLVSARKAGTQKAQGEYIVCVDADDYIKQDYLKDIAEIIKNNKVDIICTGYCRLSNDVEKQINIDYREGYYSKEDIIKEIYPTLVQGKDATHFPVNIWAKAYKRDLYSKIQLNVDDSVTIGEDGVVSIPYIYLANSMYIINKHEYVYRTNNKSMTSSIAVLDPQYPKKVYKEYIKYIDDNKYDFKQQLDRFVVHQVFSMALSQFNNKRNVKERINNILNDDLYKNALNNVEFSNFKGHVIKYILKNKCISLLHLISLFN